jgi:hypothetical protein
MFPSSRVIVKPWTVYQTWPCLGPLKGTQELEFFGFDFDFCTVSLLVIVKYEGFVKIMGGGRIIPRSLKTTGNKNCFQFKPKKKKK